MQICAPAIHLPSRVDLHTLRSSHDADQGPFWVDLAAAHTGALGDVLVSDWLLRHANFSRVCEIINSTHHPIRIRLVCVCASR